MQGQRKCRSVLLGSGATPKRPASGFQLARPRLFIAARPASPTSFALTQPGIATRWPQNSNLAPAVTLAFGRAERRTSSDDPALACFQGRPGTAWTHKVPGWPGTRFRAGLPGGAALEMSHAGTFKPCARQHGHLPLWGWLNPTEGFRIGSRPSGCRPQAVRDGGRYLKDQRAADLRCLSFPAGGCARRPRCSCPGSGPAARSDICSRREDRDPPRAPETISVLGFTSCGRSW